MSDQKLDKIRREIEDIGALPTLPEIPMKILEVIAKEDSSMQDVAKIIERDPSLAANILKVANSPYYGVRQKVATLQLALTILGLTEIINTVTSLSVVHMFPLHGGGAGLDRLAFWRHSFGCAAASQMLARELRFDTDGVEFVAGLIHDIGKLIIDQYFPAKMKSIHTLRQKQGLSLQEAEVKALGVDHATLGSWLAENWNLPPTLVESILYHHRPLDVLALAPPSRNPALTAIIHLADMLASEPESEAERQNSFADALAWKIILAERADLTKESVNQLVGKYEEYRERVDALIQAVA
ncbi:MAG: HDOD domain-containing protein [Candidatus Abyssubacteria bacterium]